MKQAMKSFEELAVNFKVTTEPKNTEDQPIEAMSSDELYNIVYERSTTTSRLEEIARFLRGKSFDELCRYYEKREARMSYDDVAETFDFIYRGLAIHPNTSSKVVEVVLEVFDDLSCGEQEAIMRSPKLPDDARDRFAEELTRSFAGCYQLSQFANLSPEILASIVKQSLAEMDRLCECVRKKCEVDSGDEHMYTVVYGVIRRAITNPIITPDTLWEVVSKSATDIIHNEIEGFTRFTIDFCQDIDKLRHLHNTAVQSLKTAHGIIDEFEKVRQMAIEILKNRK